MKLSFLKQFLSAVVLTLFIGGLANAQNVVPINFTNEGGTPTVPVSTGDALEGQFQIGSNANDF